MSLFLAPHANAAVLYVDLAAGGANDGTSWNDAFVGLQSAIDAASSGDEIWIASGSYRPATANRSSCFVLREGVSLYGGFAGWESERSQSDPLTNITVLTGDLGVLGEPSDNCYSVIRAFGNLNAVIDGVKITDGNADGSSGFDNGAGFRGDSIHGITFQRVTFERNSASGNGGAVFISNNGAQVSFQDCVLRGNTSGSAGGGIYLASDSYRSLTISGSVFESNLALAGGGHALHTDVCTNLSVVSSTFRANGAGTGEVLDLYCNGCFGCSYVIAWTDFTENPAHCMAAPWGSINVSDSRFERNKGAVSIGWNQQGWITRSRFSGESGTAVRAPGGRVSISDSVFERNLDGAVEGTLLLIDDSIFVGNSRASGGGAVRMDSGESRVRGSVFAGNEAPQGGAITADSGKIIGCTIVGNRAPEGGAVHSAHPGGPEIINSVLWDNGTNPVSGVGPTRILFVCGDSGGGETIAEDPGFVGAKGCDGELGTADDNYRLGYGSACIDRGSSVDMPMGADADGEPRVVGREVDMGAYEFPNATRDPDEDAVLTECDNCPTRWNHSQRDSDHDSQGDECDLDDGIVLFDSVEFPRVSWQREAHYHAFNVYRGDLDYLLRFGIYSQQPGSNLYANRACDWPDPFINDELVPVAGTAVYWLVTGVGPDGESGLGDGDNVDRRNDYPCP